MLALGSALCLRRHECQGIRESPSDVFMMEMEDQEYCSCAVEYGGEHRWTARNRAVMARMVQYLDRSESMNLEMEELEYCLLGPEESEVDIRHIAMNASGKKRRRLFHYFSGQGPSECLVVSAARWDEYSRIHACETGGRVPSAQQGHQRYDRKARESFSSDGS